LGQEELAKSVLDEMNAAADNFIVNKDLRTYYGVGSPSPMPFEYNIERQNLKAGYALKAYALLGLGDTAGADDYIEKAAAIDPYEFTIHAYRPVRNLLLK
jgi:hypothetical protein